jgi:hypothetical protein
MNYTLLLFTSAIASAVLIDSGDEATLRAHAANILRQRRSEGQRIERLRQHEFKFANGARIAVKLLTDAQIEALKGRAIDLAASRGQVLQFAAAA